ncbi:CD9 antigen [Trichonephila inaurata madagascariensis]|uniref:Tetraspanin n=1 Tax=Trichonephila inaurata madagascariensis TaxID=2747483 RepID=A0A8X7CDH8_9ARAC|nr:CD9 antigen [Trichonephila inaurata madagascariensis]
MNFFKADYSSLTKYRNTYDNGQLAAIILFLVLETLAGVALLSLSIWMYVDTAAYLVSDHNDKFFVSIYILMAAGSLMTLVGFLGCCGAMQESSCMLGTFSTFVILIFAAEIAGAVYGYSHKDEVKTALTKTVTNMVKNEYSVQDAVTLAVDAMQQKLACCGATGISDWENSSYNNKNKESGVLSLLSISYKVPQSCCKTDLANCETATNIIASNTFTSSLYSEGCLSKITEKIEKHLFTVIVAGISIAVIQIFGFVFSLVLCCAISGRDY